MNTAKLAVASLLSFALAGPAGAVVVDFEDLPNASYSVGNSFNSGGVQFDVVAYNGAGSTIFVSATGIPSNTRLSMNNSIGVSPTLPPNVQLLSFDYSDFCTGCSEAGITVNGVASSPAIEIVNLDGTTLGGANVSVVPSPVLAFQNRVTLAGPISTFAVGGTEFLFDNLAFEVPEPGAIVLLAAGLIGLMLQRSRRNL